MRADRRRAAAWLTRRSAPLVRGAGDAFTSLFVAVLPPSAIATGRWRAVSPSGIGVTRSVGVRPGVLDWIDARVHGLAA